MTENKKSPHIVFEATGVYSRQLELFMQDNKFEYFLLNPLEAKLQCDSLWIHKTDRSDAHQLALTHFTASWREKTGTDNLFHQLKSLSRFYNELDDELSLIRKKNTNKNISIRIVEKKAIEVLEAARYSYPAVGQDDVLCEQLKSYTKRKG